MAEINNRRPNEFEQNRPHALETDAQAPTRRPTMGARRGAHHLGAVLPHKSALVGGWS